MTPQNRQKADNMPKQTIQGWTDRVKTGNRKRPAGQATQKKKARYF